MSSLAYFIRTRLRLAIFNQTALGRYIFGPQADLNFKNSWWMCLASKLLLDVYQPGISDHQQAWEDEDIVPF